MNDKLRGKRLDLSQLGKAIVDAVTTPKTKKAPAKAKSGAGNGTAKKKAAPTKKASAAKGKKKR